MLKKLRRQFILINMGLVGLVLLCVFAAVCVSNYQSLKSDVEHSLQLAVDQKFGGPQIGGIGGKPSSGPKLVAVATVQVDAEGTLLTSNTGGASLSEDVLAEAVEQALQAAEPQGTLEALGLFYAKRTTGEGTKLAFTDSSYLTGSMQGLILTSGLIGICGMVAFFGISLFLSKWALRPVERAWSQQRQFVADASHELKTPLTVILANNNILLSHPDQSIAAQKKWVDSTGEEALHMRHLVDDLLFLARSDAVQAKRIAASLSFSELCWSVLLQFEPVAYEKQIALNSEIQPDVNLEGDPTELKQLIHILLDNACKYAAGKGSVTVFLKNQQNSTVLTVQNTGSNIPKEDLPHVFERFYRSDKARSREGGFGLGLAIAKSIVDRHYGTISAESGETTTTFTVSFNRT